MLRAGADTIWLCAEPIVAEGRTTNVDRRGASALVLVGPEGGWAEQEVQLALRAGAGLFYLGPRRLRAELAPIVALSSLWTKWGW